MKLTIEVQRCNEGLQSALQITLEDLEYLQERGVSVENEDSIVLSVLGFAAALVIDRKGLNVRDTNTLMELFMNQIFEKVIQLYNARVGEEETMKEVTETILEDMGCEVADCKDCTEEGCPLVAAKEDTLLH